MQITISSNIRIHGANKSIIAKIATALTVDNPEYTKRKSKKQPTWGIERTLRLFAIDGNDLLVPKGYLNDLLQLLETHGIEPRSVINDEQTVSVDGFNFGWNPAIELYDDQKIALLYLTMNGVLVAPAGSGKTVMGMYFIRNRFQPAIWLTHTKDLLDQAVEKANKLLPNVGKVGTIIDGSFNRGSGKLIVAMVQSLAANPEWIEELNKTIGTVVVDECHHFPAPAFIEVAGKFKATFMLGLTATPDRKDGLEVYMYRGIGPLLYTLKRGNLYETGRLIKPQVRFIYTDFDYDPSGVMNDKGSVDAGGEDIDYRDLLNHLAADEKRAKLIAENIIENAAGNTQIVLSESVRYCYLLKGLVERFAKARWGIAPRIAVLHGTLSRYTWHVARNEQDARNRVARKEAVDLRHNEKTRRWEIKVEQYTEEEMKRWQITNSQRKNIMVAVKNKNVDVFFATSALAKEGLDIPHLNIGHLVTPQRGDTNQKSNGAGTEQGIGRIMRPDPNNPQKVAIWFDYVDDKVGIFKSQYSSRRAVYKRLGITLPRKSKVTNTEISDMIGDFFF